ncbi:MAG: hypothetical protein MZV70_34745 [Desulfobacterales bacterium]|nr:hypothetical protein [Desulfobacterales bacterium]
MTTLITESLDERNHEISAPTGPLVIVESIAATKDLHLLIPLQVAFAKFIFIFPDTSTDTDRSPPNMATGCTPSSARSVQTFFSHI